ncbi:MAG TPA: SpoIIE family protein phosphatase [Draconibacterium sp.]|nr:SpoIIE family protein phosphatase [Draconibacterium sp.]
MLNKSIAYQLSVYISLSVIGVFIAFIGIFFLFNQTLIKESVTNKAITQSSEVNGSVRRHVLTTSEIAGNVADQIIFYSQQDHADFFIKSLVDKYSFINAIYVQIDSSVINLPDWYYLALQEEDSTVLFRGEQINTPTAHKEIGQLSTQNTAGWSEPYLCERSNVVVATYNTPIGITDESGLKSQVGKVYCELSLDDLNEEVNGLKIGQGGFAYLLSKQGVYITHPNEEWILNKSIYEISNKVYNGEYGSLESILKSEKAGTLISYPELFNYEKALVYYTPVEQCGWILVSVLPYKELFEPLYLPVLQMLFFSVLGILVIYLVVTYIINRQIQPLSLVTKQLKRFSNLAGAYKNITENEVIQVTESLNFMKSWYEKYLQTQTEEDRKKQQRQEDIQQASEIQQSFIKMNFPAFPNRSDIDLYATYVPARGVSGDLFDYFFIDDENLGLTIGDVSGKGVPAAFFMSIAQTTIKINALKPDAGLIVRKANEVLCTTNQHQFFLTLFLGVFNIKTGVLEYCNAAHTPGYILKPNGELIELDQSHGLPLGLYQDKKYNSAQIKLDNNDSLILYTDGVTELQNEDNVHYGKDQFEENLRSLAGYQPNELVKRIEKSLEIYRGKSKQSDDIAILVFNYKP